jgi:hypothetical protein
MSTTDIVIASMASGSDGSVSFKNTDSSSERRGILKLDTAVAAAPLLRRRKPAGGRLR